MSERRIRTIIFVLFLNITKLRADIEAIYMESNCNKDIGIVATARVEPSSALTYANSDSCWLTLSSPSTYLIRAWFVRFDMEERLEGTCVDYLSIYDGSSTAASAIATDLCGTDVDVTWYNFTTTQQYLTLKFVSDTTAAFRGFEILLAAFHKSPCSTNEFTCNNSICLDATLKCDGIDQCWDGSDEAECTEIENSANSQRARLLKIIGGSVVGALLLLVLLIVMYKVISYYYWKNWLERNKHRRFMWEERDDDLYRYPKTDLYQIHDIGEKGRRQNQMATFCENGSSIISE